MTSRRGFASMDPGKRREIAAKGGRSVPVDKRTFSQNRYLAAEAGRKGGLSSSGNFANEPARASEAGCKEGSK